MKRIFLIILDSCGAGALPDAADYGDVGANTLYSVSRSDKLHIPTLKSLGIANISGLEFLGASSKPKAAYGKAVELSHGKDTTVGHWEIAGVISQRPFPTYPNGFPDEIIKKLEAATGRKIICNKPYSGTKVINDYGREQLEGGALIVYTSADSVLQIAAHEDYIPLRELYDDCAKARDIMRGEHGVGRIIARPYTGSYPDFTRTSNRRDFSLEPTGITMLDNIKEAGLDVIAVGKINDIFAGRGITESIHTDGNTHGLSVTSELTERDFTGLCFVNLVDFDMKYGHRNDIDGYAAALTEFDGWLSGFINKLRRDDAVIITADHGCDPGDISTDHTREYTPILIYGDKISPCDIGIRKTFADTAKTITQMLGTRYSGAGESYAGEIII